MALSPASASGCSAYTGMLLLWRMPPVPAVWANGSRCKFHLRWTMESLWRVRAWERQQEPFHVARDRKRPECLMERRLCRVRLVPDSIAAGRESRLVLRLSHDLIRNDRQGNATFAKNYNNVDSHTFLIRYFIHQSNRTDIAVHAEYVTYRTEGVGTNFSGGGGTGNGACAPACGNLLGQTMLVGLDFAY